MAKSSVFINNITVCLDIFIYAIYVSDIKLRDIYNKDENTELYLPFLLKEALKVFQNDKESKYITENNKVLSSKITSVSSGKQKKLTREIKKAKILGLI